MNTRNENAGAEQFEQTLQTLPGLGYFDDDIRAQLKETAKSISQDVVDLLGAQYREARKPQTLPEGLWKPLRSKAYLIAAEHCEALASELKKAAKDPNMML